MKDINAKLWPGRGGNGDLNSSDVVLSCVLVLSGVESRMHNFLLAWPAGICLVQRLAGGARRDLLVTVWRGHERRAGRAAARHLGQLPTVPAPQRLPAYRW